MGSGSLALDHSVKQRLIDEYYLPYRSKIKDVIQQLSPLVVHLSVHSFTPIWKGVPRTVDIGLLFDPTRSMEAQICEAMQKILKQELPHLSVRLNEPYLGTDDGFTTYLRTQFSDSAYAGIEIEVSQALNEQSSRIATAIIDSLRIAILR